MKDDKNKRANLLDDICKRLRTQIQGLDLLDGEADTRASKEKEDHLKRKLLMEMLKRQLEELSG